jgi:diguanylate cyclase (GGDEF)-like protein/PAS domain S-box-containing protein
MEKKSLRVIVIDDSPDDAELVTSALRQAGWRVKNQRIQDAARLQSALDKDAWDAIVTECDVPGLAVGVALDQVRRAGLDLPFLVFTGTLGDDKFGELLREGVHDVVFKEHAARLVPVLERELRAAHEREQQRKTAHTLADLESRHRALVEGSQEAVCYCHDGMHIGANAAYLQMFGYTSIQELEGVPLLNLIDKRDQAQIKDYFRKPDTDRQKAKPRECSAVKKGGAPFPAQITIFEFTWRGEKQQQVIVTDLTRQKVAEHKLQFLNRHDPLTGLHNRHALFQELDKFIAQAKAGAGNSALLYINLEQLGRINTEISYGAGDRLLFKVAKLIRDSARDQDMVARIGGDEFMLLLPGVDATQAQATADTVLKALKKQHFSENGKSFECNCSINVTPIDATTESAQQVLAGSYRRYAESRIHKQGGPAQTPSAPVPAPAAAFDTVTPDVAAWRPRIQTALDRNALELMFQPIVNLHGDPAEAYEVLIRMRDADGQEITAAEFMPAAEQLGLSRAIDHWVVEHAIQALKQHHKAGTHTDFFINLSVMALQDDSLAILIVKALKEAGLKASSLVFEIREGVLVEHAREAATFIDSLKRLGCRFVVDDYGTRISAFGDIQRLGIDYLKLDGALIQDLTNDAVSQTIVEALFKVGKAMNKRIIAKSVQDAESLALLWNFGADYVQGHYFQPPSPTLDYVFAGESVDSDQAVAGWARSGGS